MRNDERQAGRGKTAGTDVVTVPADALQLAAAFVVAERRPSSLEVVTLDDRLAAAASKEGFVLVEEPLAQ